jgi:isopenicillin-N N-acyltransferase like protein
MTARPPFIRAHGTPVEVGRRHGAERKEALNAFLDDGMARLRHLSDDPPSFESLRPTIRDHGEVISAVTPRLAEELRGLAQGAGVGWERAVLLQIRREVIGYRKVPSAGDCTTYARTGSSTTHGPVLAQTVDLNGNLDDQIAVLSLSLTGANRRVLVLSFAGLLGYLGINSDGLAVGINLVLGGRWRPGVPPYLAIRHLLDIACDVGEAVDVLRTLPLASSRSIMLCDRRRAGFVEVLGDQMRFVESEQPVHTNHYLHPDLESHDEMNVFAGNSSRQRLAACRSGLAELAPDASVEQHFDLLCRAPICVGEEGDIRRERTVAGVVALPGHSELYVRPGDPSRSRTYRFALT